MSRSTTAVLLSALVLPGVGHLYLKHYSRGVALIAISLACLWILIDQALQQTSILLGRLASEGGAVDPGQLGDLVTQPSNGPGGLALTVASLVLVGCWVIGIADIYRIARNQQKLNVPPPRPARQ
ncbi:hypothetical protein [Thiobacillus sp.]